MSYIEDGKDYPFFDSERRSIASLAGKKITKVEVKGRYIHFYGAKGKLLFSAKDEIFDEKGNYFRES
jgi:hypothetical protein